MLTIKSDSLNPTERPIMSFKNDFYPRGIISDILFGEFRRNKIIKQENYNKAFKFINECHKINIFMSETDLNHIIQDALKILYKGVI